MKKSLFMAILVAALVVTGGASAGTLELTDNGNGTYGYSNALDSTSDYTQFTGVCSATSGNTTYVDANSGVGATDAGWVRMELVLPGGLAFDSFEIEMNATVYAGASNYTSVDIQAKFFSSWILCDQVVTGPGGGDNYVNDLLSYSTSGISDSEDCTLITVYVGLTPREPGYPQYATANDIVITATAVPEPVTVGLLALGSIMAVLSRGRRRTY